MRYEYRVETVAVGLNFNFGDFRERDSIIEEALRRLGNVGWELVFVNTQGTYYQLFLKRPVMDGKTL